MEFTTVIKRPLITEKTVKDAQRGKFTFIVANVAGKNDIKRAIEENFKVNVIDIATLYVKGRRKRVGIRKTEIKMPVIKKAVITLKVGQKIDLFDIQPE